MADLNVAGRRVLVVEDEYLLAAELARTLDRAGAIVLGPVPTVRGALALIESQAGVDIALLDVDLGGEPVFKVADVLDAQSTPYLFTTGYDAAALPRQYAHKQHCDKPLDLRRLAAAMQEVM